MNDENRPLRADIEAVCEVIETGEFARIVADVSRTARESGEEWR